MHTPRMKRSHLALVILCGAFTLTPVAPHPAAHTGNLQLAPTFRMMAPTCLAPHHTACAVLQLEPSLSQVDQPAAESRTGLRTWSQQTVQVELQVPAGLVQALLREDRIIRPVERQVSEALPCVLTTED